MKTKLSTRLIVRLLSILFIPVCFLLNLDEMGSDSWLRAASSAFICADFLLLMCPSSAVPAKVSVPFVAGTFTITPLFGLLFGIQPILSAMVSSICFAVFCYARKFSDLKPLFRTDAPWRNLEDFSKMSNLALCLGICVLYHSGFLWLSVALSSVFFIVLYKCSFEHHLPALGPDKEKNLKDIMRGDLRRSPFESTDVDSRMNKLYIRAEEYMRTKHPYLSEDFTLPKMATFLFTNKTYLSQVINYYSGRNFKQYVNYYRVAYSVELLKKDPHLSVLEVATMSGFHSTVTFNTAFRRNMNDTPGAYSRNILV